CLGWKPVPATAPSGNAGNRTDMAAAIFGVITAFILSLRFPACCFAARRAQIGFSEPVLPFGSWMVEQVPPCTNFQALPWKSAVDVPWQVVPGPAAQSFWPFKATPKHFSFFAAMAASASAWVRGPAAATVASAVETAPASMRELIVVFIDLSTSGLHRLLGEGGASTGSSRSQPPLRIGRSRVREVFAGVAQASGFAVCVP